LRPGPAPGSPGDVQALLTVDLDAFYAAETDDERVAVAAEFLDYRKVPHPRTLEQSLFSALNDFPPMSLLVNHTMGHARPWTTWRKHYSLVSPCPTPPRPLTVFDGHCEPRKAALIRAEPLAGSYSLVPPRSTRPLGLHGPGVFASES